jgi:hypothetical protein
MKKYTIIGTGPAAFFLVKKILSNDLNSTIEIYEAGAFQLKSDEDFNPVINGKPLNLESTIHVGYGGTSNLWHNVLAPLDEIDFKSRMWLGLKGWPINKNDLSLDYAQVGDYLGVPDHLFDPLNCPGDVEKLKKDVLLDGGIFENKIFIHPVKYFRARSDFEKLKSKFAQRIIIHYNSPCLEIISDSVGQVKAIIVGNNGGGMERVNIDNLILCAGLFGNLKILMNSIMDSKLHAKLGKKIFDHPMGCFGQVEMTRPKKLKLYTSAKLNNELRIKSAIRYSDEYQFKMKMNNSAFYLRPSFKIGYDQETELMKLKLLNIRAKLYKKIFPQDELFHVLTNFNLAKQVIQYKTGFLSKINFADLFFVSEQMPQDDIVSISSVKDRYGYNKISYKWSISDLDCTLIDKMFIDIDNHIVAKNEMRLTYRPNRYDWKINSSSAAHHLGGCTMGVDTSDSVVDLNNRVHLYSNLYICDGSVFASAGNANPTFTIMALANRLGRYLTNEKL